MTSEHRPWMRQGEAFWRAHHEAWKRSDLNQRQYCEFHSLPQKAFENWRQKFRREPDAPQRSCPGPWCNNSEAFVISGGFGRFVRLPRRAV